MSIMMGYALLLGSCVMAAAGVVGYIDCLNAGYSEFQCLCVAVAGSVGFILGIGLLLYETFLVDDGRGETP